MGKLGWFALITIFLIVLFFAFVGAVQKPSVNVIDMNFRGFSGGGADLVIDLEVDNPNILSGTLTGLDAIVYVNGGEVGPANIEREYPIAGQRVSPVEVVVHMQNVPLGGLSGSIRAVGTAHLRIGPLPFDLPFDETH